MGRSCLFSTCSKDAPTGPGTWRPVFSESEEKTRPWTQVGRVPVGHLWWQWSSHTEAPGLRCPQGKAVRSHPGSPGPQSHQDISPWVTWTTIPPGHLTLDHLDHNPTRTSHPGSPGPQSHQDISPWVTWTTNPPGHLTLGHLDHNPTRTLHSKGCQQCTRTHLRGGCSPQDL